MSAIKLLQAVINVSEKAANIARACRQKQELFKLLVQEKSGVEKNSRFFQDFKTLADVLIQETVKNDLGKMFPELAEHIKGEESNKFTNTLGESISVQVLSSEQETSDLLCKVLDGDKTAANLLAMEVHQDVNVDTNFENINETTKLPFKNLGIWIDPIDSTAEYIQGDNLEPDENGIYSCGLRCVTVLIGAYLRTTGEPVLGVINQPFHEYDPSNSSWRGKYFWGISCDEVCVSSLQGSATNNGVVLLSGSETNQLKSNLSSKYKIVEAAGAGYKLLCTALGLADIYILSRSSTFRWDSCAPHAILKSLGGGVVSYKKLVSLDEWVNDIESNLGVTYNMEGQLGWCNDEGIVAYYNNSTLQEFFTTMKLIAQ